MKKYIALGVVFAALALNMNIFAAAQTATKTMNADIQSIRIPAGTSIKLEMMEPVSTADGGVGDEFSAMLKEDKIVNGQIALPAGSIIRGTINKITPARRLSRCAVVYLNFDHVVTPTGRQIPISAGLYNYANITLDGGIYEGGNYGYAIQQNWQKTKDIFGKTIEWGKATGPNMQYLCVPVGAVGGVIGGGAYYIGMDVAKLFMKGNEVTLPQGLNFEVMLTQPLDIPLH